MRTVVARHPYQINHSSSVLRKPRDGRIRPRVWTPSRAHQNCTKPDYISDETQPLADCRILAPFGVSVNGESMLPRLLYTWRVVRTQKAGLAAVRSKARWRTGTHQRGLFLSSDSAFRLAGEPSGALDAIGASVLPTAGQSRVEFGAVSEAGIADLLLGVCEESGLGRAWGVSVITGEAFSGAVMRGHAAAPRMPANEELSRRLLREERRHARTTRVAQRAEPPPTRRTDASPWQGEAAALARMGYVPIGGGGDSGVGARATGEIDGAAVEGTAGMHCHAALEISAGEMRFWINSLPLPLEPIRGLPSAVRPWARLEAAGDSVEIISVKLLEWGVLKGKPSPSPGRWRGKRAS